jgi:hypothetical protein
MGTDAQLELHVHSAATGKTITHAMVSLTITTAAGKVIARVPIAQMYGVKEGTKDWHYGNNVALKPGHYHVAAGVEQTTATFEVMLGSTAMSGMRRPPRVPGPDGVGEHVAALRGLTLDEKGDPTVRR